MHLTDHWEYARRLHDGSMPLDEAKHVAACDSCWNIVRFALADEFPVQTNATLFEGLGVVLEGVMNSAEAIDKLMTSKYLPADALALKEELAAERCQRFHVALKKRNSKSQQCLERAWESVVDRIMLREEIYYPGRDGKLDEIVLKEVSKVIDSAEIRPSSVTQAYEYAWNDTKMFAAAYRTMSRALEQVDSHRPQYAVAADLLNSDMLAVMAAKEQESFYRATLRRHPIRKLLALEIDFLEAVDRHYHAHAMEEPPF